ncbi:hypothetical protein A3C77_04910 [Candidatus Giovannonibacteria bacterium RIFCSPHIGHO2_02_FULL_45_13]|nr:MAG: hypothetical protein A3C77_04910 [Candidatus Giovannonibacteria bacterium RIFCSPHIGHO2_02_FULL_45_13]
MIVKSYLIFSIFIKFCLYAEAIPAVYLGGAKMLTEVGDVRPLLVKPDPAVMKKFRPLDAKPAVREIENFLDAI